MEDSLCRGRANLPSSPPMNRAQALKDHSNSCLHPTIASPVGETAVHYIWWTLPVVSRKDLHLDAKVSISTTFPPTVSVCCFRAIITISRNIRLTTPTSTRCISTTGASIRCLRINRGWMRAYIAPMASNFCSKGALLPSEASEVLCPKMKSRRVLTNDCICTIPPRRSPLHCSRILLPPWESMNGTPATTKSTCVVPTATTKPSGV